jgi:DNA-binding NarL/FixJ family response regulator
MPPIRILIADRSDRLQTVVRSAVVDQADLVTLDDGHSEIDVMLNAEAADVVVLSMSGDNLPAVAHRLLDEYPDIGVIAIDVERDQGLILQLRAELTPFVKVSPDALISAIRKAASRLAA